MLTPPSRLNVIEILRRQQAAPNLTAEQRGELEAILRELEHIRKYADGFVVIEVLKQGSDPKLTETPLFQLATGQIAQLAEHAMISGCITLLGSEADVISQIMQDAAEGKGFPFAKTPPQR